MKFFRQRGRYVFRIISILFLVTAGLHFCNMAGYYSWLRGFPQNEPYVDILTRRYYFFTVVFLVLMTTAVVIFIKTLKKIKKDRINRLREKPYRADQE